jgi:hypothetical protein
MATFVPMRKGEDAVTANISIEGILFWHVLYISDDGELKKNGTTAEVTPFPLGAPAKLDMDVNTWHIVITNPAKANVRYAVGIRWTQGETTLAEWPADGPKKGTLKPGESLVFDGSALLAIAPEAVTGERMKKTARKKERK